MPLLQERYQALQRQVPLLYIIALANVAGLHLVTGDVFTSITHPANLLILLVVGRMFHWRRNRNLAPPPDEVRRELRRTLLLAGVFSSLFAFWAIRLINEGDSQQQSSVVLFASLASVGCAYGLSSFPAAARLPLLLAALPVALRLMFSSQPSQVAMGVSLALITLLLLQLLSVQNAGITQLVRSRTLVVTERERAQKAEALATAEGARARLMADTDALTGLMNRRAFLNALNSISGGTHAEHAVALIDLDGFKPINDTFGHMAGDEVLVEVGRRLLATAGPEAMVARMGGDEFSLILPCKVLDDAVALSETLCWSLAMPIRVGRREFQVSACCGLAPLSAQGRDVTHILSQADAALYQAKLTGRGTTALFSRDMEEAAKRRSIIETSLSRVEIQEQIELAFQPIFELHSGSLRSFEVLARWRDGELGEVSPSEFIPIAEQSNLIQQLSGKLFTKAVREAKAWPAHILLSFNLSAVELCSLGAAANVLRIMTIEGFDPARLQIEVTETTMLTDFEAARRSLGKLRKAGVRIVLDDFGAGYASVSYLREMNFDGVKLDGSLVKQAGDSPGKLKLLKGVIDLCKALDLPCVAEHIETRDQLAALRKCGCEFGQGYLLSKALTADEALVCANSSSAVGPAFVSRHSLRDAYAA